MFHQKSKRRLAWDSAGRLKARVSRPGRDKFQPATTKSRAPDQAGPFSSFRVNKVRSDPKSAGQRTGTIPTGVGTGHIVPLQGRLRLCRT
jgi:hypothetical protein